MTDLCDCIILNIETHLSFISHCIPFKYILVDYDAGGLIIKKVYKYGSLASVYNYKASAVPSAIGIGVGHEDLEDLTEEQLLNLPRIMDLKRKKLISMRTDPIIQQDTEFMVRCQIIDHWATVPSRWKLQRLIPTSWFTREPILPSNSSPYSRHM